MASKNVFDNLNSFNRNSLNIMEREIFLKCHFFYIYLRLLIFFFFIKKCDNKIIFLYYIM